jgi:hypothetical protein
MEWSDIYTLSNVEVSVQHKMVHVVARGSGPQGAMAWVRAWLSNELRTLSETSIEPVKAGSFISIDVPMPNLIDPNDHHTVYVRIESSPLHTEHVVSVPVSNQDLLGIRS